VTPNGYIRAEDVPTARRVSAFIFFMVADFFYGWSWNTADILRPDIRAALNLSLTEAGSMYSAQGLGALVGAIIIGQLADRLGRRNALFGIMIGYSVSLGWGAFVTSYFELMAQRFVLGLFMGGVFPTVVGLYTSLFDRRVCGKLAGFYNGTFNASVVVLGLLANRMQIADWHTLILMGAIPPLILAPMAYLIVPNDRKLIPFGATSYDPAPRGKLPIVELFAPGLRKQTLLIALMVGLNFFGSQAFTGWQTTYLTEVQGVAPAAAKEMFGWQFAAAIVGGFAWGALSDRFGRRGNAAGFAMGAMAVAFYVSMADTVPLLMLFGGAYGFMIAASVIWGPWIAELYPPHLRSTAASIFNWGRIISFFAPLITGSVAKSYGLNAAMGLAAIAFGLATIVWLMLPESIVRKDAKLAVS
jgi:MFS family permease